MTYNYIIWITDTGIFKTSISSCKLLFGVSLSIGERFKAKSYSSTECTKILSWFRSMVIIFACFFTVFKRVKVSLREYLSCQYFSAHSLRFLARTRVPSWLRWRPYLSRWISVMFGCLISTWLFVSSNLVKSTLFSFALCLSTLTVGVDRTILTDGIIS